MIEPFLHGSWTPTLDTNDESISKNLEMLRQFSTNEETQFVAGPHGFFLFDPSVNMLAALAEHTKKAAAQSCGKCTPCRAGLKLIADKLNILLNEDGSADDLVPLAQLSKHISETSLCGLGQSALVPLSQAIEDHQAELVNNMGQGGASNDAFNVHSSMSAPCIQACPANLDIPKYIGDVADGLYESAINTILDKYPFAGSCGRVCARPCEAACRREVVDSPVGILDIKRFVADNQQGALEGWVERNRPLVDRKEKVAIIGAGPSGLSCAYHLRRKGFVVDVFEKESKPGGMANVGIPSYRLPKEVLYQESRLVEQLGANIIFNVELGKDITLESLKAEGYNAIYIAIGAALGTTARIKNEEHVKAGYRIGLEFLYDVYKEQDNEPATSELIQQASGKVVVLGGGNVAMDCARSAIRLGAEEVHLIYRRGREEMPADVEEVVGAEEEGVIFHFLTNPEGLVLDDNNEVVGIDMVKMALGEPDKSGRRSPKAIENSNYILPADLLISAIGQRVDTSLFESGLGGINIDFTKWGTLAIDSDTHSLASHDCYLFAGGDCSSGPTILIDAIRDGINAADRISQRIEHGKIDVPAQQRILRMAGKLEQALPHHRDLIRCQKVRSHPEELHADHRKTNFDEVCLGTHKNQVVNEAERCLRCYSLYTVITKKTLEVVQ